MTKIYSIGYAGLSPESFVGILKTHNITAIADVRSSPFSKMFASFNKDNMPAWLSRDGIKYAYLGAELGPRSLNPDHYLADQVQFSTLSKTEDFKKGIDRLKRGSESLNIAIMCAEKDPLTCHRSLLVAEYAKPYDVEFVHILQNGQTELHEDLLLRAMKLYRIQPDMLTDEESCKQIAHQKLCQQYAYKKNNKNYISGARP